jgi:RND superfamily putative drug exporter
VTSAGLILAATFGVAGITGATSQIKQLGAAIALGVLIDTFLVRTLMVPAIVVLCGRYNWWPSHLARRSAQAAAEAGGQQRRPGAGHPGDPSGKP